MATMAGMALGMFLAHVTRGYSLSIWFCFLSLTIFHMYGEFQLSNSCSFGNLNSIFTCYVLHPLFLNLISLNEVGLIVLHIVDW